jgi:hypothetical protein
MQEQPSNPTPLPKESTPQNVMASQEVFVFVLRSFGRGLGHIRRTLGEVQLRWSEIQSAIFSGLGLLGRRLRGVQPQEPENVEGSPDKGYPMRLKVFAVAAGLFIVGLPIYVFWPEDTWERDHQTEITALARDASTLDQDGKQNESTAKYRQLLKLVGSREIRSGELLAAVNNAKLVLSQRVRAEIPRRVPREEPEPTTAYSDKDVESFDRFRRKWPGDDYSARHAWELGKSMDDYERKQSERILRGP